MDSSSGTSTPASNASGIHGVPASASSPARFRSAASVCGLPACGGTAVVEPAFLCYCGEPARKLTAGTERNRGRKFFVCRKSEFGKGCRLWIWEDVVTRFVSAMLDYCTSVPPISPCDELAAARAELSQMDAKFSTLRREFEIRERELVCKVQELEMELAEVAKSC